MRPETFDQLFKFRTHCLCGESLVSEYPMGISLDDDYTCVKASYVHDDNNNGSTVSFLCNIDARSSPHGEVDFLISTYVSSNSFKIRASYPEPRYQKVIMSPEEFAKKHFTFGIQNKANINVRRVCPLKSKCVYSYHLSTRPLIFDMDTNTLSPIDLSDETFRVSEGDKHYYFRTNFVTQQTSIMYSMPKKGFVIGAQESLNMNSEKFLKYPLDRDFLLNKVRTLLLFS